MIIIITIIISFIELFEPFQYMVFRVCTWNRRTKKGAYLSLWIHHEYHIYLQRAAGANRCRALIEPFLLMVFFRHFFFFWNLERERVRIWNRRTEDAYLSLPVLDSDSGGVASWWSTEKTKFCVLFSRYDTSRVCGNVQIVFREIDRRFDAEHRFVR